MARALGWSVVEKLSTVAVCAAAAVVLWNQFYKPSKGPGAKVPAVPLSLEGAATIGNSSAPHAMIIYTDFQCPFCGKFEHETWPRLRREYVDSGRLLVAFRNLPLPMHASAFRAAEAAECAHRAGKFWEMHDRIFGDQEHLDDDTFLADARAIAIDVPQWQTCYAGAAEASVRRDAAEAQGMGITGTPFFLIGVRLPDGKFKASTRMTGSLGFEVFRTALERQAAR
jgi:protein-disulfide isomerase